MWEYCDLVHASKSTLVGQGDAPSEGWVLSVVCTPSSPPNDSLCIQVIRLKAKSSHLPVSRYAEHLMVTQATK